MSRFLHDRFSALEAYTPGEQPRDKTYIKLNTNESPYPPSPEVCRALGEGEIADLRLYSDPEGTVLREKLAGLYGCGPENVFLSNGSDDILNFAFMAFSQDGAAFPSLTYSFYPVFCDLHGVKYETVELNEDLSVNVEGMKARGKLTVLANPNAPTGIALPLERVEEIVVSNPDHVVVVDEAYIDFGGQSAAGLIRRYDNLLVVMTYSKSRSMAGARLGFALAGRGIIEDLEKIKYSTNPYNVNRLTLRLGEAAVDSDAYFRKNAAEIVRTRTWVAGALRDLGFTVPESSANFVFVKRDGLDGEALYRKLKDRGILIRHFSDRRIADWNRVTVGAPAEMEAFVAEVTSILKEEGLL
jgi:histidinol-phosphate aminotransferase